MVKILPALFVLAAACLPLHAGDLQSVLQGKTQKAQAAIYPSTLAHQEGVFEITLHIRARFEGQVGHDNVLRKTCTAVLIDPNYLLASQSCKGLSSTATCRDHNGVEYCRPVEFRRIDRVEIDGRPAAAFFEDDASKTILIKANANDPRTVETLSGKPTANLFVMTTNTPTAFNQAAVNTEGRLWGRNSDTFTLKKVCNKDGCFFLPEEAQTGDPAFFFSAKKPGMEFLAGFNSAEPDGTDLGSGYFYRPLSKSLSSFLQKNVSKDAWQRIQKKIVTESFFK